MDKLVDKAIGIDGSLKYGKSNLIIRKNETHIEMPAAYKNNTILILKVLIGVSAFLNCHANGT